MKLTYFAIGLACSLSFNALAETAVSAGAQVANSIKIISEKEPTYNAVIALDETAERQAKALDKSGLKLLGGAPILVKDNIDVFGMPTTAGSLALVDNYPNADAPLVAQLKSEGAVILGKTNLSEWANFRSEKSSSGWSGVGGQTGNAHDPSRTPCGSSSGSGTAVALGYVRIAIGTETNGSIVCPASINGIVGFKPTHGLVSGAGIVPLAHTQDTAGPMADSIEHAAVALAAMLNPSAEQAAEIRQGLISLSDAPQLKGLKIGVMASTQGYDGRRDAILDTALLKLEKAGVEIVRDLNIERPSNFGEESYQVLLYEFKRDLKNYFTEREYQDADNTLKAMTLAKLIDFNNANADTELKHFDQSIFEKSQALELSEKAYKDMLTRLKKATREDGLDKLYKEHKLDALIGITVGPGWKIDHINGDAFFGPGSSTYAAIGGHPHITTPGDKIAGMPVGISFIGKRFEDHKLAQIVYRFNQL